MSALRKLQGKVFQGLLGVSQWATRDPARNRWLGRPLMRAFGAFTLGVNQGQAKTDTKALAEEWQRMFPSKKWVPITKIENDTAYAEIHQPCPYRGTGNVEGCHRMMEYDRRMMEKIGGEFVVLRSQAEKGVTTCQVAIRRKGASMQDLVAAHERVKTGS